MNPYAVTRILKKLAAAALEQDQEILLAARQVLEQSTVIHQTISNVKYAATSGSGDASIGPIHEQPPGHG